MTIRDFCFANFFLFKVPTYNTKWDFLYCFKERHSHFKEKILNSSGQFSILEKKSQLQKKILNSRENSQFKKKFSTQKIFNSRENSQRKKKFSTQEKIPNSREKSQLDRKSSTQENVLNLRNVLNTRQNSKL